MARNLYVTAMEPRSGKSVVALGIMELLSRNVDRLAFFRPIVADGDGADPQVELVRRRYRLPAGHDEMRAFTQAQSGAAGAYGDLRKRVVEAYKALEAGSDFVLCEGTDFVGATPALDFGLNADLANELGAPVLVVVRGGPAEETATSVGAARDALAHKGCSILGVIVNRTPPEHVDAVTARLRADGGAERVYVLPERRELAYPSVGEIAASLGARIVHDPDGGLERDVRDLRVAAMSVEHFVDHLVEGTLVIVPADRPDIVVASLASTISSAFPSVAGVLLTGGYPPGDTVRRLLEHAPFPVLEVDALTHEAATAVQGVRPHLRPGDDRKIAAALGLFEAGVDTAELGRRIALDRPVRRTPIMFEYELIERARHERRHVVLPEGDDDRILRAAEIILRRGVARRDAPREASTTSPPAAAALGVDLDGVAVVDPASSSLRDGFAALYHELRRHKGVTEELARDVVVDPSYFGTLMVQTGAADGMVSGAAHTTGDTIRPAFEIIKAQARRLRRLERLLHVPRRPRPRLRRLRREPETDSLPARRHRRSARPRRPRHSGSSRASRCSRTRPAPRAPAATSTTVREATAPVRERRPDLKVEGPIQYDAAVDPDVARLKLPESEVAGHATVFVFPDLDTGNVAYKAVQRSANAVAVGPVLQGLRKPVNDLSRGCSVTDIVNTVAITAIQAQGTPAGAATAAAAAAG